MTSFTIPTATAKKNDQDKPRVDLVPADAILAMAKGFTYGSRKYSDKDWEKGMAWGRMYAACQRHLLAFWSGKDIDEDSRMPHLYLAATCLAILIAYSDRSIGEDDRSKESERSL